MMYSNNRLVKVTVVMLIVVFLSKCCTGGKYSKQANSDSTENFSTFDENEDRPFRMKKVNLIWTKARKILSGQKLADLYADLKIHDRKEGMLKKLRAEDGDKDGKKEADVLQNYHYIMQHYRLDDYNKNNAENEIPLTGDEVKSVHFQDSKLQSMWTRAELSGFSDEDIEILKEEFWHQQMKLNEFDFMRRELNTDEDPDVNEIDLEQSKLNLSPKDKKEKIHQLKRHNKDIKEGYMRLEHLASTMPKKELEFKDYRVQKLWALSKKINWTEAQKDSFKEELLHFEHRLSKRDYYEEQLALTRDALKDQMKEGDKYPEKLVDLKEKTDQVKQKVKKLHSHIKTKLEKALKHTEL